jgi:hypothetical protein
MIEATKLNSVKPLTNNRSSHLLGAFGLMLGAFILFFSWLFIDENVWKFNFNLRLLPWIGATAVVLLSPTIYLLYIKKFDIFHPLVHASWSYWFPSFVLGGIFIATGFILPFQMDFLTDPETDLIWTYIHVMSGYASMTLGFYLPASRWVGQYANRKLPKWDWKPNQVLLPATVFLGVGLFFYVSAFFSGVVGFSITDATDVFSALNYLLSFLALEAGFMVAMYIFMSRRITPEHILAFVLILILLLSRLSLGGNRSSFLLIVTLLAMAFVYSGRRWTPTTGAVFGVLALLAIVGGMIYGTTFRNVKGSEDKINIEQQIDTINRTLDTISRQDTGKVLDEAVINLAERIDGVSSLAVVVSNYERLKPYEASYGLENNIYTDLGASVIPRFLWKNKPLISDVRSYSDLYFDFNGNSYALTPVGDLLRNFGVIGVPIGMLIVGIFLRVVYSALIENQTVTIGRATVYYLFLASLSYEGFYSMIFVYGGRILAIGFISLSLAELLLIVKNRK